ncbi:50S ribosomal subunit L24, putative [Theileria equi strain WA]|uniref:50S ribosomal subunit L24, putative n=1 Tax=Theileria equi strain WA TaxID=1537102 RepID=L0AUY9_THEEQ|nr:50S ribosomal subunit L24, putative [Theileria equi strain WA]AFZ79058.1 50S ribosomal subunit L24, putative [Theileria equi strain WA]|eukprot:XP_004828724.1 50S ribosomal subunit L24, putative [Theileria equi strain WA]
MCSIDLVHPGISQHIEYNYPSAPFYHVKVDLTRLRINNWFSHLQYRGAKIAKPKDLIKFWKIKPGDKVVVISGKDKGKVEEVLMCDKLRNQVKVKGCNMRKLFVDSQLVQIEKKIHYSNVQLIDPMLNCGTKVTIRYGSDNKPLRVSKKSGCVIPWPEKKSVDRGDLIEGEKDTKPEIALQRTYDYKKVSHTTISTKKSGCGINATTTPNDEKV